MGYRKYAADWSIREELDGHGRRVRTPVYGGPLFRYVLTADRRRPYRVWLPILGIVQWALFVTSLLFPLHTMAQFYIMVPYGVRLLPLFYMTMSLWTFLFAKEPLKREQNDGLYPRMSHSLCFLITFGAASLIAAAVAALVYRTLSVSDIYLLVAMAVQLSLDLVMLRLRRAMRTQELEK